MARTLLQELKRRKVFGLAAVYAVVGFGVSEAADVMFPRLGIPDWGVTLVAQAVSRHLGYEPRLSESGSANLNVAIAAGTPAIGLGGSRGGVR